MEGEGWPQGSRGELVARALQVRAEVEAFNARWSPLPRGDQAPAFAWEQLERQLVDMAPTDLQAELVRRLVARVKTFARLKPAEMVLREILTVAALVLDETGETPA
ncbi:MAG: hypothetical protein JWQ97_887 [Phenylobacterium sp.]|nr:hypothetical protein [Phenylobacterium sp.]